VSSGPRGMAEFEFSSSYLLQQIYILKSPNRATHILLTRNEILTLPFKGSQVYQRVIPSLFVSIGYIYPEYFSMHSNNIIFELEPSTALIIHGHTGVLPEVIDRITSVTDLLLFTFGLVPSQIEELIRIGLDIEEIGSICPYYNKKVNSSVRCRKYYLFRYKY